MTIRPPATVSVGWPLWERSIIASVLGLPGYAAIGIALGFTGLGVFIDLERINGLGTIFKGCYFTGCLVSVCWVKRRALFGPVIQPPLLLAVAVPGVVLASNGGAASSGFAARLLAIGTPLLNGFPTMAVTTAFVVSIGIVRYLIQRPEPDRSRADVAAAVAAQRPAGRSRPVERPAPQDERVAARGQPRPSDPPRSPERQRPAESPRPSTPTPPRGREPLRDPERVSERAAERGRPPERRPSAPDPSEDPTSILPTSGPAGPGGSGPGAGGPRAGGPGGGGAGTGGPGGGGPGAGGSRPGGAAPDDGPPPPPPRKSDLHRAQKRPT